MKKASRAIISDIKLQRNCLSFHKGSQEKHEKNSFKKCVMLKTINQRLVRKMLENMSESSCAFLVAFFMGVFLAVIRKKASGYKLV